MPQAEPERRSVPTRHQIDALRHVLSALGDGAERGALEASYPRMPTGGLLSSQELLDAERTLVRAGLVVEHGDALVPSGRAMSLRGLPEASFIELMVLVLLESSPPLWLGPASGTSPVRDEFIPERETDLLAGLGLTPDNRDILLLAAGKKFQPSGAPEVGAAGEVAVMDAYRAALAESGREELLPELVHVSLISDQLGYDIRAPDGAGDSQRLEVKTCSTRGDLFVLYLSRNEADTGRRDPSWRMVVCRYVDGRAEVIGWVPFGDVDPCLPEDPLTCGQWVSAQLTFRRSELVPGLPLLLGPEGGA